jgi:hypothetical protein
VLVLSAETFLCSQPYQHRACNLIRLRGFATDGQRLIDDFIPTTMQEASSID